MSQANLPPARVAGFETPCGHWTAEPPTEPGWYWWRHSDFNRGVASPVQVAFCDGKLMGGRVVLPEHLHVAIDSARPGGEWWSESIKEPPP